MNTILSKIMQLILGLFMRWATPIILAGVLAFYNKMNGFDPALLQGQDPTVTATAIASAVASVAVLFLTMLLKTLCKYVMRLQQILKDKGLLDKVDGWLGPKTLQAIINAVNNPSVTIKPIDVSLPR